MGRTRGRPKGKAGRPGAAEVEPPGGFYDRQYTQAETFDLAEMDASTLNHEISMLRVIMRRVFEAAASEATDLGAWQNALRILSMAANRLANLLKANQTLENAASEAGLILSQAMTQLLAELKQEKGELEP